MTKDKINIKDLSPHFKKIDLNTNRETVSACVQGRTKALLKKYQIRNGNSKDNIGIIIYKEYEFINKPEVHWCSKEVKCVEEDKLFSSITEASKHYNISVTSISNILNGAAKKNKMWKIIH